MRTFDIFCDASVNGANLRGACAGALIVERGNRNSYIQAVIQPNGTNNSGEICALLIGVNSAIAIKESTGEQCVFNIFSDSIISIRGVREWIFGWISSARANGNNVFISSSNKPVINQMYFKLIFNNILLHNLDVHFYHQDGHVVGKFYKAESNFVKVNGVYPIRLGLTIAELCTFNNYIDGRTRAILKRYISSGMPIDGVSLDNIANTSAEDMASTDMPIPVIGIKDQDVQSPQVNYSFSILPGDEALKRYATLIHASEYPSAHKVAAYFNN